METNEVIKQKIALSLERKGRYITIIKMLDGEEDLMTMFFNKVVGIDRDVKVWHMMLTIDN